MVHTVDTTAQPPAATAGPDSAGSRRPRGQISPEAVALLRMAQAGDRDAFAQIYRSYASNVRAYVATRMRERDRDAVDDLVQDTFCAALDELDRAHDDVCGWLVQLAAKMCTRHSWSRRRYLRSALTVGEHQRTLQAAAPPPEPGGASWRLVAQALAGLHPDERLTLQLRFLDAQPREAAARLMDCSVWTVSDRQRRALRRLADRLTAGPDTTGPDTADHTARPVPGHAA